MPFGEVTITLEDVFMLTGLSIVGDVIGPSVTPLDWREDLQQRFQGVLPEEPNVELLPGGRKHGPPLTWLRKFEIARMAAQPTNHQVARHLEAHLLWLFGRVMFTGTHGDTVDERWIAHARAIADADAEQVPQLSWGFAVLAATYRGLYDAYVKIKAGSLLSGMPLLLQLWLFEKFQVGRVLVQPMYYTGEMYGHDDGDGIEKPTVGSLWTRRRPHWAGLQVRNSYEAFTEQFDLLRSEFIVWEPYTADKVLRRAATRGISSLCYRDSAYWMTQRKLVFDVFVEDYAVHRVMRQFGRRQEFPVPFGEPVPRSVHSWNVRGPQWTIADLNNRMGP